MPQIPRALLGLVLALLPGLAAAADQVRVVDGDTLILNDTTYRLFGIDAPEAGQKCGSNACGTEATEALAEFVAGRKIRCEERGDDGYGREIAICYAGDRDLGREMVARGQAWAFVKFTDLYAPEERQAKARSLGVWATASEPAWDYRAARWEAAQQEAPDGCPIKGNISQTGRIYHAPWSPWYGRTRINVTKGERWFCSEADAVAAGWRAPVWK